ncbi:MAG: hypothetical protein OEN23_06010, partial [Paracoccaceae bacterium]|nr:hypothetical protein [Paracoccaceae bacterium]
MAAAAGILALTASPASTGPCQPKDLSSFSKLADAVDAARGDLSGSLLATWLLRSRDGECRFVFRVDLLLEDGRIHSMNFDARSLEPVEIDDDGGWEDATAPGAVAEGGGGSSGSSGAVSSESEDDDDD